MFVVKKQKKAKFNRVIMNLLIIMITLIRIFYHSLTSPLHFGGLICALI